MTAARRLAAILAADVTGYSRLIGVDEEGTLNRLKAIRAELIDPKIAKHRGRIVKTTGDGLLVEFTSVVDALRSATEWQRGMADRNAGIPAEDRIEFRIGINVGDVAVEDGDIFGDGVNVAARLEGLADPGGICVSARVQEDAAGRLDLTFEDLGEQTLKNIARPVRVYRVRLTPTETTPKTALSESAPVLALPDKPSIAVLPFTNMSADPEQEYFVDGMVEEIITALSRIRWLFVIARNSSFSYKGQSPDVKQVGRELGVRYVLEGSVRKAGGRVRITGQLIDAETGTHLWADRFDGSLEDVFDLQDKVAISVAGAIEPALQAAEIQRSTERQTTDPTAYDLYLRALPVFFTLSKERIFQALELLEQAIDRDPNYGPALAWTAICRLHINANIWTQDLESNRRKAIELGRRALEAAKDDPNILAPAALVLAYFGEDIGAMMAVVDRALTLNPSFARAWYLSGLIRWYAGEPERAIELIQHSLRLSPRDRIGVHSAVIGSALFFMRRFDDAERTLLVATQERPQHSLAYQFLASCYAHMGRLDEARAIVARLQALHASAMPKALPFRNAEQRELYLSGLRMAMDETQ
jgi:TolB-like protein/class 3 adenylate cyclase